MTKMLPPSYAFPPESLVTSLTGGSKGHVSRLACIATLRFRRDLGNQLRRRRAGPKQARNALFGRAVTGASSLAPLLFLPAYRFQMVVDKVRSPKLTQYVY
jgi:hypothetical protein